jgi:hypothetical protein
MIAELFLVCALAVPPAPVIVHFKGWEPVTAHQFLKEYKELHGFLDKAYPGSEFYVMPKRLHEVPKGYSLMPFSWRSHRIYRRNVKSSA